MEGWKYWEGKQVFLILKNKRNYSGKVLEIALNNPLVWVTLLDKFNKRIVFSIEEIELIQEEGK